VRSKEQLERFICDQRSEERFAGLPMKDIRVIDMATVIAAPFAATLLGDFGADVIKVENPKVPDSIRGWGVIEKEGIQPFWAIMGRNKFPVTINLKSDEGKRIFLKLIKKSDVLIENMRPGALEKLGLGKDELLKENPGLIIGSVSGYGQTGPYAAKVGFGTLAEGFSGFTHVNTQPGGIPTNAPLALADFIVGLHLAFAIMIALRSCKRAVSGGQVIDISLYEPLFGMLGPDFLSYFLTGEVPMPQGNELTYVVPRNNYKTKDGEWVTLSCAAQKPFERLMDCIGQQDMKTDPRFNTNEERIKNENRTIINNVISKWVGNKDRKEVIDLCNSLGITIGPIYNMHDIAHDPHYNERGTLIDIEDPVTGKRLKIPDVPLRILGSPGKIRFAGLSLGAANDVILKDLLGYQPEEIENFRKTAVI